jgi:hypothetical protein
MFDEVKKTVIKDIIAIKPKKVLKKNRETAEAKNNIIVVSVVRLKVITYSALSKNSSNKNVISTSFK